MKVIEIQHTTPEEDLKVDGSPQYTYKNNCLSSTIWLWTGVKFRPARCSVEATDCKNVQERTNLFDK